jgi:hypothetical protein
MFKLNFLDYINKDKVVQRIEDKEMAVGKKFHELYQAFYSCGDILTYIDNNIQTIESMDTGVDRLRKQVQELIAKYRVELSRFQKIGHNVIDLYQREHEMYLEFKELKEQLRNEVTRLYSGHIKEVEVHAFIGNNKEYRQKVMQLFSIYTNIKVDQNKYLQFCNILLKTISTVYRVGMTLVDLYLKGRRDLVNIQGHSFVMNVRPQLEDLVKFIKAVGRYTDDIDKQIREVYTAQGKYRERLEYTDPIALSYYSGTGSVYKLALLGKQLLRTIDTYIKSISQELSGVEKREKLGATMSSLTEKAFAKNALILSHSDIHEMESAAFNTSRMFADNIIDLGSMRGELLGCIQTYGKKSHELQKCIREMSDVKSKDVSAVARQLNLAKSYAQVNQIKIRALKAWEILIAILDEILDEKRGSSYKEVLAHYEGPLADRKTVIENLAEELRKARDEAKKEKLADLADYKQMVPPSKRVVASAEIGHGVSSFETAERDMLQFATSSDDIPDAPPAGLYHASAGSAKKGKKMTKSERDKIVRRKLRKVNLNKLIVGGFPELDNVVFASTGGASPIDLIGRVLEDIHELAQMQGFLPGDSDHYDAYLQERTVISKAFKNVCMKIEKNDELSDKQKLHQKARAWEFAQHQHIELTRMKLHAKSPLTMLDELEKRLKYKEIIANVHASYGHVEGLHRDLVPQIVKAYEGYHAMFKKLAWKELRSVKGHTMKAEALVLKSQAQFDVEIAVLKQKLELLKQCNAKSIKDTKMIETLEMHIKELYDLIRGNYIESEIVGIIEGLIDIEDMIGEKKLEKLKEISDGRSSDKIVEYVKNKLGDELFSYIQPGDISANITDANELIHRIIDFEFHTWDISVQKKQLDDRYKIIDTKVKESSAEQPVGLKTTELSFALNDYETHFSKFLQNAVEHMVTPYKGGLNIYDKLSELAEMNSTVWFRTYGATISEEHTRILTGPKVDECRDNIYKLGRVMNRFEDIKINIGTGLLMADGVYKESGDYNDAFEVQEKPDIKQRFEEIDRSYKEGKSAEAMYQVADMRADLIKDIDRYIYYIRTQEAELDARSQQLVRELKRERVVYNVIINRMTDIEPLMHTYYLVQERIYRLKQAGHVKESTILTDMLKQKVPVEGLQSFYTEINEYLYAGQRKEKIDESAMKDEILIAQITTLRDNFRHENVDVIADMEKGIVDPLEKVTKKGSSKFIVQLIRERDVIEVGKHEVNEFYIKGQGMMQIGHFVQKKGVHEEGVHEEFPPQFVDHRDEKKY